MLVILTWYSAYIDSITFVILYTIQFSSVGMYVIFPAKNEWYDADGNIIFIKWWLDQYQLLS